MTVVFSQAVNGIETAIASTALNALGGGSYALGAAINNIPTPGSVVSYDLADITINLSSAVTAGSGAPYLTVWILPAVDGTNFPNPPGGSGAAAPLGLSYSFPLVASASTQVIILPNLPVPPFNFKVMIQNNLGVAFPATNTSTCQMVRKSIASW